MMSTSPKKDLVLPGAETSVHRQAKKRAAAPWKYEPIQLRPCEVCGERATGYHFGVISCEACKSFYRRSLKRNRQYLCEKGDNCPTETRGASSCPACRLRKCILVGMSPEAVKKGRYSYEKRAETIIQSRSYWHKKYEGQEMGNYPEQTQYMENVTEMPDAYVEQVPSASMHYAEEVTNVPVPVSSVDVHPVSYVEEVAPPMAAYEEEVMATPQVVNHMPPVQNVPPKSTKSLREVLGITEPRQQISINDMTAPVDGPQVQMHHSISSDTSQHNVWTSDSSQVYTNLQPVPYTIPSQGNGHVAPSPGALSDDSGVYLLSPNNIPVCSPSVNSIPPMSPYKTVTISEPQTQAEIVEVIPGKVRSINMRREMMIDGKPVSYLLEGVLVAPSPSEAGQNSETPRTQSPPGSASPHSIADEMSIDGKPITLLLQNILDDISEEESSKETAPSVTNTSLPFAGIDQDLAVNQVMIDGKPIYQMFEMFSKPSPTTNEKVSLPSIATLTQKQQPPLAAVSAPAYQQIETMPVVPHEVQQHPTSTQVQNITQPSTSYGLHTGESGSPTLNDIQETAQTLINMASMPMDSAITSTVNTDDLQSSFFPDSSTMADPDESRESDPNLTYYKPDHGNRAFINALIADNDSKSGEVETMLQHGFQSRSPQEVRDLDKLIDKIVANVEKNKCITKDFVENLPALEKNFLEERKKKEQMFGKMGHISSAEYLEIYRETGLDVDGRGKILKEAMETMDPVMKKLIAFYKCLPGFQSLPLDDQVTVLKETMDVTFALVDRIQKLKLNDLENAVVAPLIVMQSEYCITEDGKALCEKQKAINLKAFHRALCKQRTETQALTVIQEIFDVLKLIKANKERLQDQCSKFLMDYNHLNFPKLFKEIFVD